MKKIFNQLLVSVLLNYCVNCKYESTWDSLDTRPLPQWYDDAKIGIFLHWGPYAVPTMGTEWFWYNWKERSDIEYTEYMDRNYPSNFSYQNFGTAFRAEHFNPDEWTRIFQNSGAKYVVLTAKHHDGYALWPTKYSDKWNSMEVGANRDLVVNRSNCDIKFGIYNSLYEWFHPLYNSDKDNSFRTKDFVDRKVMPQLKELINTYKPDIIWSDGQYEASAEYWNSKEFIAWLYNDSPVKDSIVTNDRWGNDTSCLHGDFKTCTNNFNPGTLQPYKWENCFSLDLLSWGHRANAKFDDYMSSTDLIREIVQTVSCGGNILVNVGPTSFGTIESIFVERLLDMGGWLKINGDAIYSTIPWIDQNDPKTDSVWYTMARNIRYNQKIVYAIFLRYPYETNSLRLYSLGGLFDDRTEINLLGYSEILTWKGDGDSILVNLPQKPILDEIGLKFAWTLRVTLPAGRKQFKQIEDL